MNDILIKRNFGGNLANVLLTLYITFSIFLPPLFPKKIIFILILVASLLYCLSKRKVKNLLINPFFFFVFFLFYMCVGYGVQDDSLALQFLLLTLSFFIIYAVTENNFDIEKKLIKISIMFSLLIIYMSLGYFSDFLSIPLPFAKT